MRRALAALLIWLSTAGPMLAGPQPDVSGFTILNLLVQTGGAPERLPETLGALYEEVQIVGRGSRAEHGYDFIILFLRRADAVVAQLRCNTFHGRTDRWQAGVAQSETSALAARFSAPLAPEARRVQCKFNYFDRRTRVESFLEQAGMWAETEVGALREDALSNGFPARSADRDDPAMTLSLLQSKAGRRQAASANLTWDLP